MELVPNIVSTCRWLTETFVIGLGTDYLLAINQLFTPTNLTLIFTLILGTKFLSALKP